jgi:hypothetical protein
MRWLFSNLVAGRKHLDPWRQVGAQLRGRSGENSSGGLNARSIAMWPGRLLVHLVVLVIPDNRTRW